MLSQQENEILTRVGLETPLGQLFKHFWIPVLLSSELPAPDCPPVKVEILGEHLIAFRDSENRIGLLDQQCAHRRTNLFWGRNEECGLRCAYHGWKYDVDGNCVDMPNASEGSSFKEKVKTRSFAAREAGGFIWIYMGDQDQIPELPQLPWMNVPESHRYASKVLLNSNWLQAMEGDMDSSHVAFLHSNTSGKASVSGRSYGTAAKDKMPRYFVKEIPSGVRLAARRSPDDEHHHWRVTQYMMPCSCLIASKPDNPMLSNVRVPINDEHSWFIRIIWREDGPLTVKELYEAKQGGVFFPELIPGSFIPKENKGNNYLIDRAVQRTYSYTGIKSIGAQDWAVVEDQGGPIIDRTRERLVSSDAGIIGVRRRLLQAIKAVGEGLVPPESINSNAYNIRGIEITLPKDLPLEEGAAQYLFPPEAVERQM